uniref:Thyroid adenoma-associated -like protein n=1 Tax=Sarcoptes scabiei TaxID=52283 RepID=A0A834RGU4_SARSC
MADHPSSRKDTDRNHLDIIKRNFRLPSSKRPIQAKNFVNILIEFDVFFTQNPSLSTKSPEIIFKLIQNYLASLKSLISNSKNEFDNNIDDEEMTKIVISNLNNLKKIITLLELYPETQTLAATSISFLVLNYLLNIKTKVIDLEQSDINLIALFLYLKTFVFESLETSLEWSEKLISSERLANDDENHHRNIDDLIDETMDGSFSDVNLFYGLFNCNRLLSSLLRYSPQSFSKFFSKIFNLCNRRLNHEFHAYKLLLQYLKITCDQVHAKNVVFSKNEDLIDMFQKTISIVDGNWESPVNGVINLMQQCYRMLISILILNSNANDEQSSSLLIEQFHLISALPYTCKAKYKKLSVLTQLLADSNLDPYPGADNICDLPFILDSNFAEQAIKCLSINSLASSVAEYYKLSINSQTQSKWVKLWLPSLQSLFKSNLVENTVVQNVLLAHIIPSTVQIVGGSMRLLMDDLSDSLYAQACLIQIHLEKCRSFQDNFDKPSHQWLTDVLEDSDDKTRSVGLALLVEERFIENNRPLVCQLILKFLANNMNIDNAPFRQKILGLLEKFIFKLFSSLKSREKFSSTFSDLNETHRCYVNFLSKLFELSLLSLVPGSCFQRKFSALSILEILVEKLSDETMECIKNILLVEKNPLQSHSISSMLILSLIDKDDKIRRMSYDVLNKYCRFDVINSSIQQDWLNDLSMHYIESFRHQECHIGGLLYKLLLKSHTNPICLLVDFIDKIKEMLHSIQNHHNLFNPSQSKPMHGWILSLNQCLTFNSFYELLTKTDIQLERNLFRNEIIATKIFKPLILIATEVIENFLLILTSNDSSGPGQIDTSEFNDNIASTTFLQMSESIKKIVHNNLVLDDEDLEDFSATNQFQLMLSMCWLSIKESCFLLSNLTILFADMINLVALNDKKNEIFLSIKDEIWITPDDLLKIGRIILNLMRKIRHKGIIEASALCLTNYVISLFRIQSDAERIFESELYKQYKDTITKFCEESLSIISLKGKQSNLTRKSAGLALIVQSILIGESVAINKYAIKTIGNSSLYNLSVESLIKTSTATLLLKNSNEDLPQATSLHILRSIIETSALSQWTYSTVVDLFPICIGGFSSDHWQIRNASLQLFGTCCRRMLGQNKRLKNTAEHSDTTITFTEFISRYPRLLKVIYEFLESNLDESLHKPELVPVLTLLASFSACDKNEDFVDDSYENHLRDHLFRFLRNSSWKIRSLSAKSLLNVVPRHVFKDILIRELRKSSIDSNFFHGLYCCFQVLFGSNLDHLFKSEAEEIRSLVGRQLTKLEQNAIMIQPSFLFLFGELKTFENDINDFCKADDQALKILDLKTIKKNVSFDNSDDIRLNGCKAIHNHIDECQAFNQNELEILIDILLTVLEDEDRDVRFEAQRIVSIIYNQNLTLRSNSSASFKSFCQSKAIDNFLIWILKQREGLRLLLSIILDRFSSLVPNLSNSFYRDDNILFEKEEKNAFAEPFLMNIRLVNCFINNSTETSDECQDLITKFSKVLQQYQTIYSKHFTTAKFDSIDLLKQSIWKLTKIYGFVINLYLMLRILNLLGVQNSSQPTVEDIEKDYKFIKLLCHNSYDSITVEFFEIN